MLPVLGVNSLHPTNNHVLVVAPSQYYLGLGSGLPTYDFGMASPELKEFFDAGYPTKALCLNADITDNLVSLRQHRIGINYGTAEEPYLLLHRDYMLLLIVYDCQDFA